MANHPRVERIVWGRNEERKEMCVSHIGRWKNPCTITWKGKINIVHESLWLRGMNMFFKKKKNPPKRNCILCRFSGKTLPKSDFWKFSSRPGSHQRAWLQEKGLDDCGLECVNVKIRHCSLFFFTSLWFGCVRAGFSSAALFLFSLQVGTIEEFFF